MNMNEYIDWVLVNIFVRKLFRYKFNSAFTLFIVATVCG